MYSTYRYGRRNPMHNRMDNFEMKLTAKYVDVVRGCESKPSSLFHCISYLSTVKHHVRICRVAVYFET